MTAQTEAPEAKGRGVRQGTPAQGRRAPHHRPDQLDRQHHAARDAAHRLPAQPVRARPDHLGGRQRGQERAGRDRRLLRRGLRRRAGQPALRLAGHAGHRDPGAPADGGGRGALRRRGGGLRRGPRPLRRGRRAGRHRGRLRAASAGARHQDGPGRGLAQGPRGGQQELRVALRPRRHGGCLPRRADRARAHLPPAAADPGRDGAARGGLLRASAASSRCGPRPRSRTSCGSCSPWSPASRSRASGSSRRTSAAGSGPSCRSRPKRCWPS